MAYTSHPFPTISQTVSVKAAAAMVRPIRPDIDNLAKLVLDALNGIAHSDDKQVVKLVAHKLIDTVGACGGRTVVEVAPFHECAGGL